MNQIIVYGRVISIDENRKELSFIENQLKFKQQQFINVYLHILLRKTGKNYSNSCVEIDLHGFSEKESIYCLECILDCQGYTGIGKVKFVTGIGKHSSNQYNSVIKKQLNSYLTKNDIYFEEDQGSITIFML